MRVVVVGASGNVGSAVLRRLAQEPAVTSVVGVARRVPRADGSSTVVPPFDAAEWVRCDLADPPDDVAARLDQALAGADAVVHLAWAIQPSHDRAYLERVNVQGTRLVADAALRLGVPHLVVASSVGAYSPSSDKAPRTEAWPTSGVAGSDYSEDKVAVERYLDGLEVEHPRLVVSRVRPALVFQRDAASEIARYFLGALGAFPLRRRGTVPFLPWPRGLVLQAVHADDLADAYVKIVVGRHPGAFNIAPEDVLTGPDVAAMVAEGEVREVSPRVARGALAAAWRLRAAPVGAGWLDLALGVPVLDATRARELLPWAPAVTGQGAARELFAGIVDGAGIESPPMLPG